MPQEHHNVDLDPFVKDPNHPHTPKRVSVTNQDGLTWHCGQAFEVIKIEPAEPFPFYRPLPFTSTLSTGAVVGHLGGAPPKTYVVNTGPARPEAVSGKVEYKITFRVNGKDIDPHFIVDE
jgi:hypothetical protein